MNHKEVRIALLGCGQVGQGLVSLLKKRSALIEQKTGIRLKINRVLVHDIGKKRGVPKALLTRNPDEAILDLETDIVVELLGGLSPARELILKSLRAGKNVVTANKAVLAHHGEEILRCAFENGKQVHYEASVCAGIPVIRSIREGLLANRVSFLAGILNGTTNYILTQMKENGLSYEDALELAQKNKFAEPDPFMDVSGTDTAHKLAVLASLAFGVRAKVSDIYIEGISQISMQDIRSADAFGYAVKLLGIGLSRKDGLVELRVHPTMVPKNHPLAGVRNENNAVLLHGDAVGEMMFYGKGAGPMPTASALLSDIIELSMKIVSHSHIPDTLDGGGKRVAPFAETRSEYYLRFPIHDKAGVIAKITTVLGRNDISIYSASAELNSGKSDLGNVLILAKRTTEGRMQKALKEISRLSVLKGRPTMIRIY